MEEGRWIDNLLVQQVLYNNNCACVYDVTIDKQYCGSVATLHMHDCDNCVNIASGMLRILHVNPKNNHLLPEAVGSVFKDSIPKFKFYEYFTPMLNVFILNYKWANKFTYIIHKHLPEQVVYPALLQHLSNGRIDPRVTGHTGLPSPEQLHVIVPW